MSLKRTRSSMAGTSSTTPESLASSTSSGRITRLTEGIPILNAQARKDIGGYGVSAPERISAWIQSQSRVHRIGGYGPENSMRLPAVTGTGSDDFSSEVLGACDPKGRYYLLRPIELGETNTGIDEEGQVMPDPAYTHPAEQVRRQQPAFEMSGPYVRIGRGHVGLGVH